MGRKADLLALVATMPDDDDAPEVPAVAEVAAATAEAVGDTAAAVGEAVAEAVAEQAPPPVVIEPGPSPAEWAEADAARAMAEAAATATVIDAQAQAEAAVIAAEADATIKVEDSRRDEDTDVLGDLLGGDEDPQPDTPPVPVHRWFRRWGV